MSDFELDNPVSAASGGITVVGNGIVVHKNGMFFGRSLVVSPPVRMKNPDLIRDQGHISVEYAGWQPSAWGEIDATVVGETIIPFWGADEFSIREITASHFNGASDSGFRFEIWSGPGGTKDNLVTSRRTTKTTSVQEEILADPASNPSLFPYVSRIRALYVQVTVAHTTSNLRFRVSAWCRATATKDM